MSCYVPFERTGNDVRQNGIRVKNCQRALATAHEAGAANGSAVASATRELERAADTVEDPRAPRPRGLAVFASADECVTVECASPQRSSVTVAPRYYLIPLVALAAATPAVLVLALSKHAVRLIDPATARELPLPRNVPRALTDVVGTERRTPTFQQHSVGNGAVFHGHGEGDDDVLPEIAIYCRRIADALASEVTGADAAVVLAGDVQIAAIFRRAAPGWPLLEEQIHGNHDRTAAAELAALAAPLVTERERAERARWKAVYGARCAEQRASDDARDIAAAAHTGRIETLLLEQTAALGGLRLRATREPQAVQREGRFNSEAVVTLRCGGDVRIVPKGDMPTRAPQAAIFRF